MSAEPKVAIAVVGVSAILPDAPTVDAFWKNLVQGRYSITEVDPERWDPALYYDPDPKVPDKTYSKIGGWVREWAWDPIAWRLPIPPLVSDAMDDIQKWAISLARAALVDYGWPARPVDFERTGVIIGNALAGERQWLSMARVSVPEYERDLAHAATFASLPASTRTAILEETRAAAAASRPPITEDTMPGELANVIAGRVANLFDMHGPNYVCDAACASALAAMNAAVDELIDGHCDVVLTGGIDRTMNATAFVKFCKIGALSATGTRPYAEGADGFVMGEGGAMFVVKRLADAERDGDRIYAVVRGLGGSSDGKGKGITAPNPIGQRLAVERAWKTAGLSPATATLIEGHGTSTRVGDMVEVQSLAEVLREAGAATGSVGLGSVKSNFGHLKAAAGAAGLLKTVLALHHRVVPPSLHCERPNPELDFAHSPLRVVTTTEDWSSPSAGVRRAGVSAFGFGGTNFHAVLEEFIPARLDGKRVVALGAISEPKAPVRGAAVIGAATQGELKARLERLAAEAQVGREPARQAPAAADLRANERIAIDFGTAKELAEKCALAMRADSPAAWKALRPRGIFRGSGPPAKVAFLFTGQGSQYANMLAGLRRSEPVVTAVFDEADRIMLPLLGRTLSDVIFVDPTDTAAVARAEASLRETEITQPAVMTVDLALAKLLDAYGIGPDMVMGHSLGEYGALMAAQSLTFEHTLEAVSARGREMSHLTVPDRGVMAAVIAPIAEIEKAVAAVGSGVVIANVNSTTQGVIGGPSVPVRKAMESLVAAGFEVVELPVSHAFHTSIVAPASGPLKEALVRLGLRSPDLPVVANVTGKFYPMGSDALPSVLELLGRQVAEPVQFVTGLRTLYDAGARVFVEVGPKRALQTFAEDVLGGHENVLTLFTNHPKTGELESFNQALCGFYAAGLGAAREESEVATVVATHEAHALEPVVITGAALGLPGTQRVFDDGNLARILAGEVFIDVLPTRFRRAMLSKHVTRLVKREGMDPTFETIDDPEDVIRLAARAGAFDLASEFGVSHELVDALDRTTQLAIGAGIDAMRDAGIPLVMHYRKTKTGTQLPEHWALSDGMRDDTGVIFASAMPGLDRMTETVADFERAQAREQRLAELETLRSRFPENDGQGVAELERMISDLRREIHKHPYEFDRRFLFRVLSMGHSQFAQFIGARGPNTQINAACASTTQAVSLAQDWIRAGRCRRVLVIAADDATSERLMEWVGAGFLASGAAATDDVVENAAIPFDRRRHGMVIGMGAAAMVVESAEAARERGVAPICEVLATVTANSAFHGTRLDPKHISHVMERLVGEAERECGVRRADIAPSTVFVSHETYTPARGGSAAAEVDALRSVFGDAVDKIVVANTKGFTGHPMGVGIEDVVAVKSLETGIVPPVPNFKERDPDLGPLNLSRGGAYEPAYALRLAAGFGSQISMALLRKVEPPDRKRRPPDELGYAYRIADRLRWQAWLQQIAGRPDPEVEIVNRTLRIKEVIPATKPVEVEAPAPLTPTPAPEPAQPAPDGADPIAERVLELVAEKTGYPKDMLGLDLDLEADLGVDTVKQAELFALLRETYGFARDDKLQLRDFPTLAHVIRFVHERTGVTAPAIAAAPAGASAGVRGSEVASKAASAGVRGFESPAPTDVADPIAEKVLELVAEKTGYPKDMLGLDLDLEADLGVDTVKQAELFALLRETYGFERDEKLQLRDFPTLAHVIKFVHERTRPTASPSPAPISEADAFPRRIPVAVPAPPLDMCASTRVRLDAGARIAVVGAGETATQLVRRLNERGCEVLQVEDAPPSDDLSNRLKAWTATAPVRGLYWLPPLEVEPPIARLDFAAWKEGLRRRVVLLHAAVRALGEQIGPAGTFLVSATALGGRHGYGSVPAAGQMGGAVTGFTKAMRRERPDALVKAVDFGSERRPEVEADQLIEETLFDPANVEVGRTGDERWTVRLEEAPAGQSNLTLGKGSTIVVTGAAGSIVSAIVADLAAATSGTFHLLDLVREPDPSDPDIRRFASDPSGLKLELAERLRARGERPTPGMVEKQLAAIERAHAALSAMESVKAAGGRCFYHSVDITDPVAVARVIDDVRGSSDHIDVLLHAAGVEISHLLPDKEDAEFARVFGVKTDGWFNVLKAAGDMPIGAIIAFSSVAGRFGNAGQTDYSAANDLLCKSVSNLRGVRPDTHAVAIDWTAWAEIGMATRGSIPKLMELAGIEMLPPKVGIPTVRREIMGATSGEVVVAGQLGALLDGADPIDSTRNEWRRRAPLLGNVAFEGPTIRAASIFDPKAQPFLDDHRIEGVSVLPGVMGVELMAELAGLAFPGMAVAAVEDVDFAAPFKFYRDEPREVQLEGQVGEDGGDVVVACRLSGSRTLAGRSEPQATTHFTARVRLSRSRRPAPSVPLPGDGTNSISADAIYKVYFHGPAFRVLEGSWPEGDRVIGRHAAALPALTMPAGGDLVSSPRLVELCFQTVGLLELGKSSRLALPAHIDRLSFYERRAAESPIFAVVNQPDQSNGFSAQVVDPSGRAVIELEGYRTVAIPLAIDVALLEPFRHAVKATVP